MTNEEFVRQAYAVAEVKDVPAWVACFNPDGVFVDESVGITYRGPNEVGKPVENYGAAFSDMHRELYDVYATGDVVVVELALQGHDGPLGFHRILPPTGNRMTPRAATFVSRTEDPAVRLLPVGHGGLGQPCWTTSRRRCSSSRVGAEMTPSSTFTSTSYPTYWTASNDGNAGGTLRAGVSMARSRTSTRPGSTSRCCRSARPACTSVTMWRPGRSRQVNEYLAGIRHDRPDRSDIRGFHARRRRAAGRSPTHSTCSSRRRIDLHQRRRQLPETAAIRSSRSCNGAPRGIHPTASPDRSRNTRPAGHAARLPGRHVAGDRKLHYSNTFARTPDIKYVFVHAGGTIPFVASRFGIVRWT
jgi:hypothetical protein